MNEENQLIVSKKLNIFQKIKRAALCRNVDPNKLVWGSYPQYLLNDSKVIYSAVTKTPDIFFQLNESQRRLAIQEYPQIFLQIKNTWEKINFIENYPECFKDIFDELSNTDKVEIIERHSDYIKYLSSREAFGYIIDKIVTNKQLDGRDRIAKLINKYISKKLQIEILTKTVEYSNTLKDKRDSKLKVVNPDFAYNILEYFSPNAVEKAINILVQEAKSKEGKDWKDKRQKVPLLSIMEIENLPIDTQLKLVSLDPELAEKMSFEAAELYIAGNPMILKKMNPNIQLEYVNKYPKYSDILDKKLRPTSIVDKGINTDNLENVKNRILSEKIRNSEIYSKITDYIREPAKLIELSRFEPDILETYNLTDNYSKYAKVKNVINLFKSQIKNTEVLDELNKFQKDVILYYKNINVDGKMSNLAKVLLNEKVMLKTDINLIIDFIRNPNMDILKEIIAQTYGENTRDIFEDRPNIKMSQIQNLDIFDEKIINKFGVGVIHNALSYKANGTAVLGELARNSEYMKRFDVFSEVTNGYFDNSPVGLENKLIVFYKIKNLFGNTTLEDFTEERKKNLLIAINDKNMTNLPNETSIIKLETLEDLDNYHINRDKIYDDYVCKSNSELDLKEAISRRFFGMQYGQNRSEDYKQRGLSIQDMIFYYNMESFVSDERTQKRFTNDEIDQIQLLSIISKINNPDILKEIYNRFSKEESIIINPVDFKEIREKIPQQYSRELVESLFTIDKAKEMIRKR